MTHCPSCGAPYELGVPVCKYCGTIREDFEDGSLASGEQSELDRLRNETEQLRENLKALQFNAAQQAQFDNIAFQLPRPAPFPTLPPPPVFAKCKGKRYEALSAVKKRLLSAWQC